ncbi:MAG: hypothetical protein ACI835_003638 [Planctomycetota bacterium]|jgi:hypothetical protein
MIHQRTRFAVCIAATFARAQTAIGLPQLEWPGWRGPLDDGHAEAKVMLPLEWSEKSNVRWKVKLPGLGNSSSVIAGDRAFLTAAIELEIRARKSTEVVPQPGPPNADHRHQTIVLALERATGVRSGEPW